MLQFNDAMLIGETRIDTEHKMLFDIINNVHYQIKEQHCSIQNAMELIENLVNYAETHFKHEEEYMESINDPEYSIQKKEHDVFRKKVIQYKDIDIADEEHALDVLDHLLVFLAQWLYRHILSSDTLIGKIPVLDKTSVDDAFIFTSKYKSGIDFMDEEHKELFSIIGDAYNILHNESYEKDVDRFDCVMDKIDELKLYTVNHFAHEEEYMLQINYSGYEEQVKAHRAFVYKIDDVYEEINHEDVNEYLEDLVEFLLYWLSNHICIMDLKIPYVEGKA